MTRAALPLLWLLVLLLWLLELVVGPATINVFTALADWINNSDSVARIILQEVRVPRALLALLTGASLAISGAALQGLLRNPLASPDLLGISQTAALLAVCVLYFGWSQRAWWLLPLAALLGAALAVLLLLQLTRKLPGTHSLILAGLALTALTSALTTFALSFAPNPYALQEAYFWLLGSVANRSLSDIALSGPIIAAGALVLLMTRRGLSALTLGEEAAHGLGLDLTRTRVLVAAGCGLATGGSVALAGAIGFVGIVTPHLVRPLVGSDPGRALVPSALAGGVLLVLADVGARLVPSDNELKLGVVAALVGAPIFLWIAARRSAQGKAQ